MSRRKHIESQLATACRYWGAIVKVELIDARCTEYCWQLTHEQTVYEVTCSDAGDLVLISTSNKYPSRIREIYAGDNTDISYQIMIGRLVDNFTDIY